MVDLSRTTHLAKAAGISKSYASQILKAEREGSAKRLGMQAALRIFRTTGQQLGPLKGMGKAEASALAKILRKVA